MYHLNLPEALMEHILLLMEKAPPCVSLDESSLRRQGRIEQGSFSNGFAASKDGFGYSDVLSVFGRPKFHTENNGNTDIFFSTETKAIAFILMALKLCFGLDDVREFHSSTMSSGSNSFNFMHWYYQFIMRLMFWEGYDPLDVLQTSKPVEPLLYDKSFWLGQVTYDDDAIRDEGTSTYRMIASIRDIGFTHSIPSSLKMDDVSCNITAFVRYFC
ncbi:hypothetical protein COOONC_23326 [Cooperia oncophora]